MADFGELTLQGLLGGAQLALQKDKQKFDRIATLLQSLANPEQQIAAQDLLQARGIEVPTTEQTSSERQKEAAINELLRTMAGKKQELVNEIQPTPELVQEAGFSLVAGISPTQIEKIKQGIEESKVRTKQIEQEMNFFDKIVDSRVSMFANEAEKTKLDKQLKEKELDLKKVELNNTKLNDIAGSALGGILTEMRQNPQKNSGEIIDEKIEALRDIVNEGDLGRIQQVLETTIAQVEDGKKALSDTEKKQIDAMLQFATNRNIKGDAKVEIMVSLLNKLGIPAKVNKNILRANGITLIPIEDSIDLGINLDDVMRELNAPMGEGE